MILLPLLHGWTLSINCNVPRFLYSRYIGNANSGEGYHATLPVGLATPERPFFMCTLTSAGDTALEAGTDAPAAL